MTEYLVVDGYNILHDWKSLKKILSADLEHARSRLIDILSDYQAIRGIQTIVVFDAHHVKGGSGSREIINGIEVVYTAEGETADTVIEKLVGHLGRDARVTVATSDWDQQRIVFGQGAVRLSARELELEVVTGRKDSERYFEDANRLNGLRGYLKENIRETLEKMRRQK